MTPYIKRLKTAQCTVGKLLTVFVIVVTIEKHLLLIYSLCRVDIEADISMFAYYYIWIGLGVMFVSYFQVCIYGCHIPP